VLSRCEQSFENIEVALPIVNDKELSKHQQYLWENTYAVSNEYCPQALSKREPGVLNYSRWLITANRLLRLYVCTEDPSEGLKALAHYVVNAYAPMWFEIKSKPSCKDGARHLWQTIHLLQYLPKELKNAVVPVFQQNAYFSHSKNILLLMITDERKHIRELGLHRILKTRRELIARKSVRIFSVPVINCDTTDYVELIDW